MGTYPQQASLITKFVMVKAPSAYNVILGRPTLNQARAVVSTYRLVVKFPTPQGVGILRGDQAVSRSCYVTSQAFDQLGISSDRLRPVATLLVGFNGSSTQPLGMIELSVLIGTHLQQAFLITNFVVVKAPSAYNVILGRPTLN